MVLKTAEALAEMSPKNYHIQPDTNAFNEGLQAGFVSFSIHRDRNALGETVHTLYLQPIALCSMRLNIPDGDTALVLGDDLRLRWSDLRDWVGEGEIVHLPARVDPDKVHLIEPLLLCPEEAVPTGAGSRLAISIQDGAHGVVITPEPKLLHGVLRCHLTHWLRRQLRGVQALPSISDGVLEALCTPSGPAAWTTLHLDNTRRYWTLEIITHAPGAQTSIQRLISEGDGGSWRSGWEW